MTKNIIVVDSQGKKYGATYLKRAKGLVKHGRARFLAQNMLCLACPPDQDLEDNMMSEQTNEIIENNEESRPADKYSMEYCLTQIEHLAHQTDYLDQAILELNQLDSDPFCGHKAVSYTHLTLPTNCT